MILLQSFFSSYVPTTNFIFNFNISKDNRPMNKKERIIILVKYDNDLMNK
jgi:hypothetical protein